MLGAVLFAGGYLAAGGIRQAATCSAPSSAFAALCEAYQKLKTNYVDNLDEQIAATQAAKLETIKAFHGEFYGASHSELAVVGDFDPKDLQALVAATLSEWQSRTPYARVRDPYHDVPPAELSQQVGQRQQRGRPLGA